MRTFVLHGAIALIYLSSPASSDDSPCRGTGRLKTAATEIAQPTAAAFGSTDVSVGGF